jgi:phosphoribosylformimino-5-aminoimidazole carboxamide ribotide isomerase
VRCIFVLDIFNGAVVHAVRGERSRYEAIEKYSKIVSTSDPLRILREIRPQEVYIADLNRLTGSGENLAIIDKISRVVRTMADIGISNANDLANLPSTVTPILGTETASFKLMEELALQRNATVSIDMKSRTVLARDPDLAASAPLWVLRRLNCLSLGAVILLELDRVGTFAGLDREFLEKAVSVSEHQLILGGGVKGAEDLQILEDLGFSGALVATAVHNGAIPAEMLR